MVSFYGPEGLGFRVEFLWSCGITFLRGTSKPGRQLKIPSSPQYAQDFPEDHEGYPLTDVPTEAHGNGDPSCGIQSFGFLRFLGGYLSRTPYVTIAEGVHMYFCIGNVFGGSNQMAF